MRNSFLALFIVLAGTCLAWAEPPRALLMVWDSGDKTVAQLHRAMVDQIKMIRAQGRLATVPNFSQKVKVYDFHLPDHAYALRELGVSKSDDPYIAVVSLDAQGVPSKVVWGVRYDGPQQGIDQMAGFLHLAAATQTNTHTIPDVVTLPTTNPGDPKIKITKQGTSVSEGPGLLGGADKAVKVGDLAVKLYFSIDQPAKYLNLGEWADKVMLQPEFDKVVSHDLSQHWVSLPTIDTEKNDTRLLLGFKTEEKVYAWVVVWHDSKGWKKVSSTNDVERPLDDHSLYDLTWDFPPPSRLGLRFDWPKPGKGWTKNNVIYKFTH